MTTVAISGIRDVSDASQDVVELALLDAVEDGADDMIFGGALGIDTMALILASSLSVRRTVVVPFTMADQPRVAQEAIVSCADTYIELEGQKGARGYHARNDHMLELAGELLAFTDGRTTGGTAYTIRRAAEFGIPTRVVLVDSPRATKRNPRVETEQSLDADVYSIEPYIGRKATHERKGAQPVATQLSRIIRDLKEYRCRRRDIDLMASIVADYIATEPALDAAGTIMLVPRRAPGRTASMQPVAEKIAALTGKRFIPGILRTHRPEGAYLFAERERFPVDEHADSMQADPSLSGSVVVLDDVVTTGGSIGGAFRAILRDSPAEPVGLAPLYAEKHVEVL